MEIGQSAPLPQIHSFECNRFLNALNPMKPLSVLRLSTLTLRSRDPQTRASHGSLVAAPRPTHSSLRLLHARLHPARRTALGIARDLQVAAVTSCGPGCRPPRPSPGPRGSLRHPRTSADRHEICPDERSVRT